MEYRFEDSPRTGPGLATLIRKIESQFGELAFYREVTLYRDFILQQKDTLDVPERVKCNRKSAQLRQEGNRLYLKKEYMAALEKYNESICFAETGSEQLGIGFGNRSAVYFEQGEFEFALANIALARKHNYPEKLLPKLVSREQGCRDKLRDGQSKGTEPCRRMDINVKVNPKIPFVAEGIAMKVYDKFGRGLIAKKDFRAGDVIMDEKPVLATATRETRYISCGHCAAVFHFNLIPCPGCVSAMYCSEACLQEDARFTHRFECSIADKIWNVTSCSLTIGPKQFFYGLTQFGDNLQEMMDYCRGEGAQGVGNPFELDFRKNDLLEQFKVLQKAGVHHITNVDYIYRISAAAFYAVFMKHPLLQKIVTTEKQRDFLLNSFLKYIRNCYALILDWNENGSENIGARSISSLPFVGSICNHSCDPNASFATNGGRFKLIVIRPIREGEQIMMTYGPTWWEPRPDYTSTYTCRCVVCEGTGWRVNGDEFPPAAMKHYLLMKTACKPESAIERADLLNMTQQFVNRYAYLHPNSNFGGTLRTYRLLLVLMFRTAERKLERARAMAAVSG